MAGEKKKLNIGVVGYGFMGRTHSNAFGKVSQFFDLKCEPVLKAACGRDESGLTIPLKNFDGGVKFVQAIDPAAVGMECDVSRTAAWLRFPDRRRAWRQFGGTQIHAVHQDLIEAEVVH